MERTNDSHAIREDNFYDVVVVGSGYGGSVAACRLSMAGFDVCLLEKGRKWEAKDFPTDSYQMLSAVRLESRSWGVNIGPRDALFQMHHEHDAIAVTACGLGGGSLINAGVVLRATARARRDPRWPKAWANGWDRHEASALGMLRAQSVPTKFQNSKVTEGVLGDDYDKEFNEAMKLSINFDMEEQVSNAGRLDGSCLACGNCLSGCPYNAKLSTDKTYLVSAVQAGCTILTECDVQCVIRNINDGAYNGGGEKTERRSKGQWLVFLNEFDYIEANIVILAAGVLGTSKILFQSQQRGLLVSQKLGSGLSCNGNNVAFVTGSLAPLNAVGLDRKQFSGTPYRERPGPSISSAYTSSSGFTIESAVVPVAYLRFLFKGIVTYRSQFDLGFLHGIIDILKHVLGLQDGHEMILNAIGFDDSNGRITFDKERKKIFFQPPVDHQLPRKIEAFRKFAKKVGGVIFMSRFRSTSVHLLGGCVASSDVSSGVCNPNGQVFDTSSPTAVHPGLYICDASIIPSSVGINPCLTIATVAEYISGNLLGDATKNTETVVVRNSDRKPGITSKVNTNYYSGVRFVETMRGQVGGMQCIAHLMMRLRPLRTVNGPAHKSDPLLRGEVGGYIECRAIEMDKLYIIHGEVDLCETKVRTPHAQYMHYHLLLAAASGARYVLEGRKIMNPYLLGIYAWEESTTLNVTLRKLSSNMQGDDVVNLKGKLHISPFELLKTLLTFRGESRFRFVYLLLQSLFRTYILQTPRGNHATFTSKELSQETYPQSTMHDIETDDGLRITCQHWKCSPRPRKLEHQRSLYPVLLINGYATESFCLPTEQNDLIRTLLSEGHDVWLLHARYHWSISSNVFSIEDVGRFDIPATINKIDEFYGESTKVHVVAHCVGGLAIHMSLMGGHVSARRIASLSCTNSSMFYKLTTSSLVKLWLPLIPMSMILLGKNTILPMLQESPVSFRQKLLKQIARLIPRYERCTCEECEVLSGIFGNAFWHENVSPAMHYWMTRENLPRLPMSAFPHLRTICKAGIIVDNKGNNSYLIHPERMSLPTLYISGGRTLLVTPETSFLAHKYMKMHQPNYRHERVVVDGFGHSDLLMGERSHEEVFPHIQKHIELSEEERNCVMDPSENEDMKEALSWGADPYEDGARFWDWILPLVLVVLFVVILRLVLRLKSDFFVR